VISGKGVEMVLTPRHRMGCALLHEGVYVPNLELAHHPLRRGKTYEELLGNKAFEKAARKKWNREVRRALEQISDLEPRR